MLTSETRKHIDSARQVLVGKVPDPKSQVNEITNALIYKFMDDMDEMTASVGGKRRYFVGDYEKYSWRKIMDPKVGAHERISLYTEALARLSKNEKLPELFRNIFSRAYLPFNDGRTLSLFLQEIDYFDYKNSESLGDAYEYLLSIMGSQGDAGQFRTPRHIIDFIVDVVDPDKNDSVLDPACGTAGFLISAYKHVMAKYDGKDDASGAPTKSEKKLSADERKKLHDNYFGFDIDDNMVKMAQVNMYLHGFLDPDISVHDTLSSEDYWNDKYDVILANPPFMSPKGGVMPHNKFGVESTRAEVLFVDYITTHLKPRGRAGIIVPEGIIFQSGTAYKQLRKNLVNDGLYAVVSLPSGVFNPYAGVKTSILLFDNELSKKTQEILFVKIENDGFDLGAQRREISKNDLPQAIQEISAYRQYVITRITTSVFTERIEKENNSDSLVIHHDKYILVKKTHIAGNGEYNLSGDRYRVATDYTNAKWPMVELREVCKVLNGYAFKSNLFNDQKNGVPVIRIRDVNSGFSETYFSGEYDEKYVVNDGDLLIGMDGVFLATIWKHGKALLNQRVCKLEKYKSASKRYISYMIQRELDAIQEVTYAVTVKHLSSTQIEKIRIPLPPLEIQEQIVAELDGYAGIIAGAKQITQNWKPKIDINPEWEKVKLGEISDRVTKGTTPTTNGFQFQESGINFIKIESIDDSGYFIREKFAHINQECNESIKRSQLKENDILFSIAGALGRVALIDSSILPANTNQALAIISPKKALYSKYLEQVLRSDLIQNQIFGLKVGVAQSNLSLAQVSDFEIPLPPLAIQKQIVEKIEAERALVESAKKLIEIYEEKTKNVIAKLWEQQ